MAAKELPEMPAGPVLELHGQRKRFHIPQGLKLLLEEASREVLREQPENIYKFLADFIEDKIVRRDFNTLLGTKDAHRKSWEWRRWSWDGSSLLTQDELLQFLSEFHISLEVAEHLAIIIQSAYRGFIGRQDAKAQKEGRQRRKESLWEEWRHEGNLFVSRRDVEEILAYYGITLFEANAFATKIQAVFRGHYHRQSLKRDNPELAAHLNALGITHWEATQKATKIQSLFRGYKARKQVKEMRDQAGSGKGKLKDGEVMGEDYEKEYDGEDYGRPGSMAMAKNRYKKTSRQQQEEEEYDPAAAQIQTGSRRDGDRTDEEEGKVPQIQRTTQDYVDPANPKPKYDAYFPGGVKNAKPVVVDGVEVPPVFSHEHFGEIDPAAIRQKFSTMDFKQRMSQMFKELEETKEDRKREMEMTKKLSTGKVSTEIAESRKTSLDQAKSTDEKSPQASVEQAQQGASGSRQPSLDQGRKPSDPPVQGPDSRKTSLEQGRKASDPPGEGPGSRKASKEEEPRKASLEQARKPSDPKPDEAHGDKTEVHQSEYRGITDDRKISDETNESIKELLEDTLSVTSLRRSTAGSLRSQASIISTASSGTRAANRIADEAIKTAAATKIQSSVRGMQTRSKTSPMLNATKSSDPGAAASASGSRNPVANEPSGTRGPNAAASAAGSGNPVAAVTEAPDDDAAIESATAIKIQAKVRGHQARSKLASAQHSPTASTTDANKVPDVESVHSSAASSTASTTRSATENQSAKVGKDPEIEMLHDAAATKIQSRVRGMQTRSRTAPMLMGPKNDAIWVPTPYPTPNQYRSRSRSPSFYNPELDPRRAPEPEGEDEGADDDVPRLDAAHWAALEAAVASQHGSIFLANVERNIEAGLSEEEAFLTALDEEARLLEVNGTQSQMMLQNRMLQEQERVIETEAAIKIQARVRGMQTRAHLHEMEEAPEDQQLQYDPRASIGSAISFYVPGETSNVKKIKEQQEREHPTLKPKKEIPKNKGKVAEKLDEKAAGSKSKPKGVTNITPSLLELGYPKSGKVNNHKNLPRHQTATFNKKFPAGSRSSALDKFLIPSAAPDSIYASPRRAPEPPTPASEYSESRSEFDLGDYDDDKDDQNYDPPEGVSPEEWARQLDAVVDDVERRLAKKHLLPYPYHPHPHPHPLAEMPIRITSQTTVGQHVDQVLDRALGVASALENSPDLVSMPVPSTPSKRKSVVFRDMPEESPATRVSQPQSNTSATVPEPRAILSATTPEKPSISLASMISEMEDEISEEWLDLSFLGIPSDWSSRVQDFLDEQLQLVTGVITGEIPASEAPVQTIGLSVAFVVGMGAGYALLKAVFDKDNENVPVDVAEVLTEVTGTVTETAPKAASASAQGVCKL